MCTRRLIDIVKLKVQVSTEGNKVVKLKFQVVTLNSTFKSDTTAMFSFVFGNCSDLKISFNFLERAITHHM